MVLLCIRGERKNAQVPRLGLKPVKGRAPLMSKAGVLEGGEQVNTLSFTPASHSLVCSCAALVTQLFFQMKAVPTPRMDLDTSNVFKIHKKLSEQS